MKTTAPHRKTGLFSVFLSNFVTNLELAIIRFPVTFLSLFVVAVLLGVNIEAPSNRIEFKWIIAAVLSAVATLPVYLSAENRFSRPIIHGGNLIVSALLICFSSQLSAPVTDAQSVEVLLILVGFSCACFFAKWITDRHSLDWWSYVQQMAFHLIVSGVFAGVLMGGLSLALVSINQLFEVAIAESAYQYLAIVCFVLFMPSYYLSHIESQKSTENELSPPTYPITYKVLGLYIILPLLTIYTIILYGYLVKIITVWELPNGWVSWLVSILGFTGLLTLIVLHPLQQQGTHKIIRLFAQLFPKLLFPLLILMLVGIIRRFSDYGITINRLLVLILNLWFIGISIYLTLSRTKQLQWIPISFATLALLSSMGPWSVTSITKKALKKELTLLLAEANRTNSLEDKSTLSDEQRQDRLADVLLYIETHYGIDEIRPMFTSLGEKDSINDLFKQLNIQEKRWKRNDYFHFHGVDSKHTSAYDIAGYKTVFLLTKEGHNTIFATDTVNIALKHEILIITRTNKDTIAISLKKIIEKHRTQSEGDKTTPEIITAEDGEYKLVITALSGETDIYKNIKISHIRGILLLK